MVLLLLRTVRELREEGAAGRTAEGRLLLVLIHATDSLEQSLLHCAQAGAQSCAKALLLMRLVDKTSEEGEAVRTTGGIICWSSLYATG